MNINVADIKNDEQIDLRHEYESTDQDLNFDDWVYTQRINLSGVAKRMDDSLFVSGRLDSECDLICSYCLKKVHKRIDEPFEFVFDVKGKKYLDITNTVREHLIFLHPQQFKCSEECKGLCPHCGINLNEHSCSCTVEEQANTFSQLKEWIEKKEKE